MISRNIFKHSSVTGYCKRTIATPKYSRVAYSTSSDEEFLHRSRVPTEHFQKSLPRLPIPKLEDTCQRYLASQTPLLTADQLAHTTQLVEEFKTGAAQSLHEELVATDKKNKQTSYISGPWFDMYLKDRRAVVLNHNPFMAFKDDERPGYNDQLIRATNFIHSSVRFLKTYRGGHLEPEVFHLNPAKSDNDRFRNFVRMLPQSISWYGAYLYKAFPLDMSQFPRLFNSTRIPRPVRDELYTDESARHLLVLRKGNLYAMDVLQEDGNAVPASQIQGGLKHILENPEPIAQYPLGVLTTQDRDFWSDVREKLVQAGNESALKLVDGALFALVLDEENLEDPSQLSRAFLHSDGVNRWYDKSFSLIIAGDGKSCVNFEHSWGDGVAVLRYFNEVFKDSMQKTKVHPGDQPDMTGADLVKKIEFNLTDDVKQDIQTARAAFAKTAAGLDLSFIQNHEMGKNFIKKQKFSPDAFMQFGIQLAYYRQSGGQTAATYESCSTAAFRHGRTETIRPCTIQTKAACEMFEKAGTRPSPSELRAALDDCSRVHGQLTKEAAMGQGFDRHLFAMKAIAAARGGDLPAIYQDPAYANINHVILSTSTLSSPAILIGGFAPVVPNGYGIGYGIEDESLGYIVTSYPPHRDVHNFLDCVKETVHDLRTVFEGRDFK